MTTKFDNWVRRCDDLKLHPDCIRGLAFFLGLSLCKSQTHNQSEVDDNFRQFIDPEALQNKNFHINNELSQSLFIATVVKIKSFCGLFPIKFPEGRINSDGRPTTIFNPHDEQNIFELNGEKLVDIHELYENFLQKIGEGFSIAEFSYEHSLIYSSNFITRAMLEDLDGYHFFQEVFMNGSVIPPIYQCLLSKSWNEFNLSNDGYLPFQTALGGYISGIEDDIIDFIWNCQRILFFNQTTLEKTNLDYQWVSIIDFILFINHFGQSYFAHEKIKAYLKSQQPLLQRSKHIDLDWYKKPDDVDIYQFIVDKIKEKDGYDYETESNLSESNRLQFKAVFFFKFIITLTLNTESLEYKENS